MIIKNSTYDIQPNSVKLLNRSLYQSNNKININSKSEKDFLNLKSMKFLI